MPTLTFPAAWPDLAAPVANLLAALGTPWMWWALAGATLAAGLLLHRRHPAAALALAAAAALALGVAADGLVDDAYIQFRYAANLAAGNGPVFNPGERIEGASGGLWIAVLAGGARLTGLECGVVGRGLALLLAPVTALLAGLTLWRRAPAGGALAALAWAALPTPALYAATGLETTAAAAALWLAALGIARDRRPPAATGAVLLVAFRPEAPLLGLLLLPWWRRLPRAARAAAVAGLAAAAGLTLARLAYYGEPVPHSAVVKAATSPGLVVGLAYLGRLLAEAAPLLAGTAWLVSDRPLRPALLTAAGAAAAVAAGGGDWMPGTRYLLPVLCVLPLAAGWRPSRRTGLLTALQAALCLLLLAPAAAPEADPAGHLWRQMARHRVQSRWWEAVGHWLHRTAPAGWTVATGPAGALPYASGLRTFDLYGLTSRVGGSRPGGEAGHRAWGLPRALAGRVELVYGVEPVPQDLDADALRRWAVECAARHPELAEGWQPLGLLHPPSRHLDVLSDIIWVRRDLLGAVSPRR